MMVSPQSKIDECTARGWWGDDTIDSLFRETVAAVPGRAAVIDPPNRAAIADGPPRRLDYAGLDALVDAVAAQLLRAGVGFDDFVLVQMPNLSELLVTLLACGRIGAVASPVAVQYREHELRYIAGRLRPRAVVTLGRIGDHAAAATALAVTAGLGRDVPVLAWGDSLPAGSTDLAAHEADPGAAGAVAAHLRTRRPGANDVLTVCWTSGTESQPKGVPRSHNHWLAIGRVVAAGAGIRDGWVVLNPFPMVSMASIGGVVMPWVLHRCTMVMHHPFDLPTFLRQMAEERVNYNLAPPAVLNRLMQDRQVLAGLDLSAMRSVCSGSAPLAPWMLRAWQDAYGINIVNFFGSNEGVSLASGVYDVPDPEERARYFPRFGVAGLRWQCDAAISFETRLVDTDSGAQISETGRTGELCIRGATVFDGYFEEPALTAAAFDDAGFYHTGDLFELAGDGDPPRFYRFVGRRKEIIIRGGQNVSPAELDGLVSAHPSVAECACVGVPDEIMGERVCAAVVLKPGATLTLEELKAHLERLQVAKFKWPERLVRLDALPKNPLGKVPRPQLREVVLSGAAGEAQR